MNPLDELRGEVEYVHPLERARQIGLQDDERWMKRQKLNQYDGAERAAGLLQQQAAIERSEIAHQGYSNRQLADLNKQRDDAKAEEVAELKARLAKLDPEYAKMATRTAESTLSEQLARGRAAGPDEFMLGELVRFEKREKARKDELTRQRIQHAETELSRAGY